MAMELTETPGPGPGPSPLPQAGPAGRDGHGLPFVQSVVIDAAGTGGRTGARQLTGTLDQGAALDPAAVLDSAAAVLDTAAVLASAPMIDAAAALGPAAVLDPATVLAPMSALDPQGATVPIDVDGGAEPRPAARPAGEIASAGDWLALLEEAGRLAAPALEARQVLAGYARAAVPGLADFCIADLLGETGQLERAAAVHRDPAGQELLAEIAHGDDDTGQSPAGAFGAGAVMRDGRPVFHAEVAPDWLRSRAASERELEAMLRLAPRSLMIVPVVARTRPLGALCFGLAGPGGPGGGETGAAARRFGPAELALAQELAQRAALTVDNVILLHEVGRARGETAVAARRTDALLREARQTARRKDEFLAMLAHELRNPLAAVANAGQLLARTSAPDTQAASMAALIGRQVRHLGRLVDDLLDVSRLTRGLVEIQVAPVELGEIVASAIETARPLIEARRHRLALSLPELPLWLRADATRIEQVIANLLDNAAKFTPPGGRLSVAVARGDREVAITVADDGCGIDAELLSRVFELFVQEDCTLARSHGGLGLGLTLVRDLVRLHGGTVTAASEGRGKGTRFTVRLPLAGPPGGTVAMRQAEPPGAGPSPEVIEAIEAMETPEAVEGPGAPWTREATEAPGVPGAMKASEDDADAGPPPAGARAPEPGREAAAGTRILLVEDNRDAAEPLVDLLRLWGHDVAVSHDGPEALAAARAWRPEVVLLDIGLPGMDGYQVARALRAQPELAATRLIAVTGYGQAADRHQSRQAGFDHHLVKPVDIQELRRLVSS